MFLIITASLLLILIVHHYLVHNGRIGKFVNLIPGPKVLPLVGNVHSLQGTTEELWSLVRKMGQDYYPIYRIWSFTQSCINIRHPNDVEVVLGSTKFINKSMLYKLLEPWFSTGLLTSSGAKWQNRRKILTPAFHFNVLQQFAEIFIEEGERMCDSLKTASGPVVKDLMPLISEHTLNAICETAMGTSLQGKGEFQYKYRKAVYDMGKMLIYRLVRPWLYPNAVFNMSYAGWKQAKTLKILHGFTRKIIGERKDYHDQTDGKYLKNFDGVAGDSEDEADFIVRKKRLAMLDLLIAAHRNNQIDVEGIREEVDTFMFEGHDTTAAAICYTIMLLAEHKDIQEQARAEVNSVFEEVDGKLSISVMQRLPFLERCIKEALRLYPSVHFISREVHEDMYLRDYMIPAGSLANIHIVDIHRDPNFWPNPEVFDPDRFLPEKVQGRHPYSYVPFSAGSRNCIGQRFAMLEMKTMLSLLLSRYTVEPVDYLKDLIVTADLVIRPAHPIRTRFVPIK